MTDQSLGFTIGDLAKAAGVSTPTIRYYEDIGLLPRARRSAAGQRLYGATDLDRLTFVRRCRDFGFDIDKVRRLLVLSVSPAETCAVTRDIAAIHLAEVRNRLSDLQALESQLGRFVTLCDDRCARGPARDCAIFAGIASEPAGCC